jgi:hypothetical protein
MTQLQNSRRGLVVGEPYYLPITVPFTNTINEPKTVWSEPAKAVGDLEIIGATMDLESVQGHFSINKIPIWSSDDIPLVTMFGKPDSPKPVLWYQRPTRLLAGARVRADLTNVGGEQAGTLVFICRQLNSVMALQKPLADLQDSGEPEVVAVDSEFTGVANEIKRVSTSVQDYDFLIRALHSDLGQATIRIIGLGGKAWMEQSIPIWALAGKAASPLPNQPLQPPTLIPAGYAIQVEFTNVGSEQSGHLYLIGQRLPRAKGAQQ